MSDSSGGSEIYGKSTEFAGSRAGVSLYDFYALLASFVGKCEIGLNSTIKRLQSADNIGQAELLALQSKIQSWGNLCSSATGLLRSVGDALKATSQNVR
ncbi:MAG: hypothetical protein LBI61_01520 [Puniceicoccales bacterium]|jgi:hypothetical protein|nr:hypothetical protein [Puniceicoccales bacterium]